MARHGRRIGDYSQFAGRVEWAKLTEVATPRRFGAASLRSRPRRIVLVVGGLGVAYHLVYFVMGFLAVTLDRS